jgi:hypothetical protein
LTEEIAAEVAQPCAYRRALVDPIFIAEHTRPNRTG